MTLDSSTDRIEALLAKQEAVRAIIAFMTTQVEMDIHPIFDEALSQTQYASKAPMVTLHLADEEANRLNLVNSLGLDPFRKKALQKLALDGKVPPSVACVKGETVCFFERQLPAGLYAMVSAPVKGGDLVFGSVSVMWPDKKFYSQDKDLSDFLVIVGRLLGLAVDHAGLVSGLVDNLNEVLALKAEAEKHGQELNKVNQKLVLANKRLSELSRTDGLTGLYNHRYIHQRLSEEIVRAKRQGHKLTVIMSDLDHFKRVNDRLGHQVGDEALRFAAGILKNDVRQIDMVGRYGGEEFLTVLVDCDLPSGLAVAEKLRRKIKITSNTPPFNGLGGFTISMGVAQYEEGLTPEDLIAKADNALYQSKATGRDRVTPALLKTLPKQDRVTQRKKVENS